MKNEFSKLDYVMMFITSTFLIYFIFYIIFFLAISNIDNYDRMFEKHGVYKIHSKDIAISGTENILHFFFKDAELSDMFTEKEKGHLTDVKNILKLMFLMFLGSAFFLLSFVLYCGRKNGFIYSLLKFFSGSCIICVFLLILYVFLESLFGFDVLFEMFHIVFFKENYAFNPNTSYMKSFYPDLFFQEMLYSLSILTFSVILTSTTILIILKNKRKINF